MSAKPKLKPNRPAPFHLEPDSGAGIAAYSLIRAAYNDRVEEARAILKANPEQINLQDPFAGLTALHIAIFRQNTEIVLLLANHPRCDITLRDNFQRTAADMLVYSANPAIFDCVMRRSYPEQERAWGDDTFDRGTPSGTVMPLRPPIG